MPLGGLYPLLTAGTVDAKQNTNHLGTITIDLIANPAPSHA